MRDEHDPSPAETYEHHLGAAIAEPFARVLVELADPQPGERALDLACGTGSVARQVAPLIGADGRMVAVDINPDMLAVGRARPAPAGAAIEWLLDDAVAVALPDASFDLVLCQQGLQFFTDRTAAVQQMRRVVVRGGRVAVSVWRDLRLHPVYEALFEATTRHLGAAMSEIAVSFSLSDPDELRALLDAAGFERVAVTPRVLEVHLPTAWRFVELTVLGAATSVPAFARLDAGQRSALVAAIAAEADAVAQQYRSDGALTFPMATHIATAFAPPP